eukprot:s1187_g11.t3
MACFDEKLEACIHLVRGGSLADFTRKVPGMVTTVSQKKGHRKRRSKSCSTLPAGRAADRSASPAGLPSGASTLRPQKVAAKGIS